MGKQQAAIRWKRIIVVVHLWLGLSLGSLWALQGLTGALLVFHRELDQPNTVRREQSQRRPLDELITAARQSHPGPPESIGVYYPDAGLLAVTFAPEGSGKVAAVIDPATAQVLRMRERSPESPRGGNMWRWIYNLHHELLLGERGQWLLGASGILLFTSSLSGLYLAWPRRGQWRAAFAMQRWHTRLQKLFGWHRTAGLAAALTLVLLALSGALMDFGKPLRSWAERHAGYKPPFKPVPGPVPQMLIGAEAAVARAQMSLPDAQYVSVALPTRHAPVYQVRMRMPGEWRSWSGTSLVVIEPAQGHVIKVYNAATAPLANRVLESAFAVHSGEVAGLLGRLLTIAAGLSLPLFYITGIWIWLRKRSLRSNRRDLPSFITRVQISE